MRLHQRRRARNFDRYTIAHNAMTRAVTHLESGHSLDTRTNAGPHLLDYGSPFSYRRAGFGNQVTEDFQNRTFAQRECSFLLCDGRLMGPQLLEDYPGGEQQQFGDVDWTHVDYAVLKNIEWTAVFAAPRFDEIPIYLQTLTEDGENYQTPTWLSWPVDVDGDTLETWLDELVVAAIEGEFGDVWHSGGEVIQVPYIATLMRSPLATPRDLETDVTLLDDFRQRSTLLHAPVGAILSEETEDIDNYWSLLAGNGFESPHYQMGPVLAEGPDALVGAFAPGAIHNARPYRCWEPQDAATNILFREAKFVHPWLSGGSLANQVWQLDDELTDLYEPVGTGYYGRAQNRPMHFTMHGRFPGEIVISHKQPEPLFLHFASAPIRLGRYITPVTGTTVDMFARPWLMPIHWNITCNLKTG